MRTEDDFGAVVDGPIDCRQRRANASVIRNLMCIIEGDVEISSNDDALVSQYDIVDRLFAQSHGGSGSIVLLGMEARVNTNGQRQALPRNTQRLVLAAITLIRSRT